MSSVFNFAFLCFFYLRLLATSCRHPYLVIASIVCHFRCTCDRKPEDTLLTKDVDYVVLGKVLSSEFTLRQHAMASFDVRSWETNRP
jgi:hypothetical protein